jgi:protoporphyrin/coproporphyrin ferrochelatase
MMTTTPSRTAIVLLQLGGPDGIGSIEPFLYNLFCDPDIIDLPGAFLFRKGLARFISSRRAPKVAEYYRRIGGRSPILKLTLRQAAALQTRLRGELDAEVFVAMRYWHPMTEETVARIAEGGFRTVVLLPLYPHYSRTTTGSSVNEWNRIVRRDGASGFETLVVEEYCDHPEYVSSLVRNIGIALRRVPQTERSTVHLVFSAHGTPLRLVRQGDPYQGQIRRTTEAVLRAGNFGLPSTLCYQSRVGPQKWLEPSLTGTVERLASEGVRRILVVPVSFVSDHSETLYEINMEVRRHALAHGISHFDIMPALNTSPPFIEALARLAIARLGGR